ncbi:MAG: hypothetical protein R3B84_14480 [Zavarzinella sp.]
MSNDQASALQALENYRSKIRHRYDNDRKALEEVLRQILASRIPKKATALVASLGYDEVIFNWDQGSRSPSVRFVVTAGAIPFEPTVFATMNLSFDNFTELNCVVLTDLVIDAWANAGGFQATRPLVVWRTLVDSSNVVPEIVMSLRETISRLTAKCDDSQSKTGVSSPAAGTSVPIRPEDLAASFNAEPNAMRDWAEWLDTTGFSKAATLLRWLEEFRDQLASAVAFWISKGQGLLIFRERADTWWSVGEEENSTPGDGNPDSANIGELLAAWADFYPAFEWFCRTLGYTHVFVHAKTVKGGAIESAHNYHLAGGEHLMPIEPTAMITEIHATAATN